MRENNKRAATKTANSPARHGRGRPLLAAGFGALVGVAATVAVLSLWNPGTLSALRSAEFPQAPGQRSLERILLLPYEQLQAVDAVELNLAVAKDVVGLKPLSYGSSLQQIQAWAQQLRSELPQAERQFAQSPQKWNGDIDRARVETLVRFLQRVAPLPARQAKPVFSPQDPTWWFLQGPIQQRKGSPVTLPVVALALAQELGWPVKPCMGGQRLMCRFDDGKKSFLIDATSTDPAPIITTEADAAKRLRLPPRAIKSGSDLGPISQRQLAGVFLANRAQYLAGRDEAESAQKDLLQAAWLYPASRNIYNQLTTALRGQANRLFEPYELASRNRASSAMGMDDAGLPGGDPQEDSADPQAQLRRIMEINAANQGRGVGAPGIPSPIPAIPRPMTPGLPAMPQP